MSSSDSSSCSPVREYGPRRQRYYDRSRSQSRSPNIYDRGYAPRYENSDSRDYYSKSRNRNGISGTEAPALDTIIMGTIGQIVDLVNNGKVKATTRTVTMVTITITAHRAMVRTNISSVVEGDRIGVIVNMTTVSNIIVTLDTNHNHMVAMVRTTTQTTTLTLLLCQNFLALSPKMV